MSLLETHPEHTMRSLRYPSESIPSGCLQEQCIIGIDEAGRGPVLGRLIFVLKLFISTLRSLGPLVYSLFICPESQQSWLRENGANDSKLLTVESREAFFEALLTNKTLGWRTRALHPEHISNCMLRPFRCNLNELSYATVYELIASILTEGISIREAFVDTLGKAEKYEATLTNKFPGLKFTVRSKADSLYPVVGAASIVAKVIRDDILKQEGIKASGYPGDAATVTWLQDNVDPVFGFPSLVRFSWSTCVGILEQRCHSVRWHTGKENVCDKSVASGVKTGSTNRRKRASSDSDNKENRGISSPNVALSDPRTRHLRSKQQEHYYYPLGAYPFLA